MADNNNTEFFFEDISSSSPQSNLKKRKKNFGNGIFVHLDKIIKAISFIVAIAVLLVFAAIGTVLIMLDKIFLIIAVGVFIVGILLSLISLFLIYAVGHIISQNNEIINRP